MQKYHYINRTNYQSMLFFSYLMIIYSVINLYIVAYSSQNYIMAFILIIAATVLAIIRLISKKSLLVLSVFIFLLPHTINTINYAYDSYKVYNYTKVGFILSITCVGLVFLCIIFLFLFEKLKKSIFKILSIISILGQSYLFLFFASSIVENSAVNSIVICYIEVSLYVATVLVAPLFMICVSLKKIKNVLKASEIRDILLYETLENQETQQLKELYILNLLNKNEYYNDCIKELNLSDVKVICDKCGSEIKNYSEECPKCHAKTSLEDIFEEK